MYWWYVVHLWVEGVWELIMASVLAFLMIKLNGIDREVVEKWLYVIIGLALFSGILPRAHHYYWIGAPGYWQWIGSLFSTLEVAPFFTMVIFTFVMTWKAGRKHPNKAPFFGRSVARSWPSSVPVSGASCTLCHRSTTIPRHPGDCRTRHLAFFGAYVMLNLAIMAYAIPEMRGRQPYNQWLSIISFWMMCTAMSVMTFALTFAGVLQVHLQRVLGESYMAVQDQLALFYWVRLGSGAVVLVSALMFVWAVLMPGKEKAPAFGGYAEPAE